MRCSKLVCMLPLANRRVLITRPRGQASALAIELATQGAETMLIPTIELAPPASYCALDAALASIRAFDWLLFTSANAVEAFTERARQLRLSPHPKRIAVIGPATAAAVRQTDLAATVDLVPARYVAEAFAEALLPHAPGSAMLLVRAAIARDVLPATLTAAGAQVTIAEAYRNVVPAESISLLRECFATPARQPHVITFTSASTAVNLRALLDAAGLMLPHEIVLASIGPVTSQAMREAGFQPDVEAGAATIAGLVDAIVRRFQA